MPQNCSVPCCPKKVYGENGVKISYHRFPDGQDVFKQWIVAIRRDVGVNFQVTEHSRVCSRHFKPSDYKCSIAGRKNNLKDTAVPSVFAWKKGSPVKQKPPKHRSPIKRKSPKKTSKTAMISASSNSTCVSFPADSRKNQESSDLLLSTNNIVNSDISPSGKLLNDAEKTIRDLECENAKLTERIRQLTAEIEQLTSNNNQLQAKVFSIDRFIK